MNEVIEVPVETIRPFAGQPRLYFDPQALQELADSLKEHGQSTPAWVVPLEGGGYELIAGERRWRACQQAGMATLRCEVRPGLSREEQYLQSVMENFGRKGCTTMETARSVGRMLEAYGNDRARVAAVFARSVAWVQQYSYMLRLHPEVAARLEPPQPTLTMQVALSLANLQPEAQVRLAAEIAQRSLNHKAALAYVRKHVTPGMSAATRGRKRTPADDFEILRRFLTSLGPQAEALTDLGETRIAAMFAHRDAKARTTVRAVLAKRIEQLKALEAML